MAHVYQLKRRQFVKASLEEVWNFVKDPHNLSKITPSDMDFTIQGEKPATMYPGMMIRYRVKPLFGLPLSWLTEITHVEENTYFVDEQRLGPYRLWHHEHHLIAREEGVEMLDIVTYSIGFGFLDPLLHRWIVQPQLKKIFDYRERVLEEYFL